MNIIDWLLDGDAYVRYATRKYILGNSDAKLKELKSEVLADARIKAYLSDVADFNAVLISGHKNPGLPIHKLIFLLDIGLSTDVPEIDAAVRQILANKGKNGMYNSMMNVPVHFGGTGKDALSWALCDAPLMLYALLKAGMPYDTHIRQGAEYTFGLQRSNGFPCHGSDELGKFRGPGRKEDCCPFATLIILRLMSGIPEYRDSKAADSAVEALLYLWENSREQHPYMFYMGTDFRKLKAPALWYDIVSVSDCLSHFERARKDNRFHEMLDIIESKANPDFQFTPESVYLKCKEWDFGQKKTPSQWLTYLCVRILLRCGRIGLGE
ncbi:MAG: hypothetical protein JXB33_04395 [Clostridia bacterium]|nr:hypothetical protein [Clostridia bacterium]